MLKANPLLKKLLALLADYSYISDTLSDHINEMSQKQLEGLSNFCQVKENIFADPAFQKHLENHGKFLIEQIRFTIKDEQEYRVRSAEEEAKRAEKTQQLKELKDGKSKLAYRVSQIKAKLTEEEILLLGI